MNSDTKYYELSYIIAPTASEDEVRIVEEGLRELLGSMNAVVDSWDSPKRRRLSYEINRNHETYAGALRFNAAPSQIPSLKETLKNNSALMRFMVLQWKKPTLRRMPRFQRPIQKEEQVPTDEKALNEKLEEILAKNI